MRITEKNGYRISELTLGTVQLGMDYGIHNTHGVPTYSETANILQTALDSGIISFDTAKDYGKSEAVLGRFFSQNPAEKTIITKVCFKNESIGEVRDSLFNMVKDSAKVMGLEQVPVVLLHAENYLDTYGSTLINSMKALKDEGLAGNVGISFSDKTRLPELTDTTVFDCVQIPMNMLDSAEIGNGKVKKLADAGIAVFARSVYLKGLFFMDSNRLPEKIKCAKPALDKLRALATENGMSMAELAVSFIKGAQDITSLLIGCETCEQLRQSVFIYRDKSTPLPARVVDKILEIAEETAPIVIRPWEWD